MMTAFMKIFGAAILACFGIAFAVDLARDVAPSHKVQANYDPSIWDRVDAETVSYELMSMAAKEARRLALKRIHDSEIERQQNAYKRANPDPREWVGMASAACADAIKEQAPYGTKGWGTLLASNATVSEGVITYSGGSMRVGNAFGAYRTVRYDCIADTRTKVARVRLLN